jgi:hypothetical protein
MARPSLPPTKTGAHPAELDQRVAEFVRAPGLLAVSGDHIAWAVPSGA